MSDSVTAVVGFVAVGLDAFAIFRAVSRDHGVERTLAWIFAILALPGVGALAYLALASPSVRRTTRRKAQSTEAAKQTPTTIESGLAIDAPAGPLFSLATRLTGLVPTHGNGVLLLAENEHAFERIESSIRSAKKRILAEYYLVRNDATGHRFLELLTEKASQGVEVRLIYDAVGSLGLDAGLLQALEAAGGKVATFLPVNPFRKRWAVHLRNHRKLVIVDERVVFTGGMNIGDEYSGRAREAAEQHFRDTHLEIRGPAARCFRQVFIEDWLFATEELLDLDLEELQQHGDAGGNVPGSAVVGAIPSGPDQEYNATRFLYHAAIGMARERVFLTSPYFIPDAATESALICAALRGVDVRILLPARCDVRLAGAAARSYYRALLEGGVRLFHYEPSMLHAKTLLVDDVACVVGSANADIRSFRLNFEIGALVSDREVIVAVQEQFESDLDHSRELIVEEVASRHFGLRLIDSAARLLSPLL